MKRRTKLTMGAAALLLGTIALSGCTASFCSVNDQAHMLYVFDYGVTAYYSESNKPEGAVALDGFNGVYVTYSLSNNEALSTLVSNGIKEGYTTPTLDYWVAVDSYVLNTAIENALDADGFTIGGKTITSKDQITAEDITINNPETNEFGLLSTFGYLKFYDSDIPEGERAKLWANWELMNDELKLESGLGIDHFPNSDFVTYYKKAMNTNISAYRACVATQDGRFGYYGKNGGTFTGPIDIEGKSWGYAWSKGFLEGLLIYPIGWCVDTLTSGLLNGGVATGVAQILAIIIVTIVVRGLMLLATHKSTAANAKMTEIQPELAKIQAKYPNANTSQNEKMRLADETQKLYKKHGINPFSSIIVMIVQFPVFIAIWGALSGSALLSTGEFLGLNLSSSISTVLFDKVAWTSAGGFAAVTALVLFILMSATQVVSMLLPQWIQKSKQKKVSKMGRNPAQKSQNNKMQMFTYVMMAMIIFMGFSLASGMGVYWLIGAIFSIGQTLITQAITAKKSKK